MSNDRIFGLSKWQISEPATKRKTASADDQRGLFADTARRLGTNERNVEKDFWVCWTLDVLFNALRAEHPRLLFKGGTSLSKAYGLISRFSEDIDITVFRDDLGEAASVEALEAMSGKARGRRLDAIRDSCSAYINGPLARDLSEILTATLADAKISESERLVTDPNDPDKQTLLLWYPSVIAEVDDYVLPAIRIESGAKSALDPHAPSRIVPYVADDIGDPDFAVDNVTTVTAARTFWDKIIILHGLRRWYDHRGVVRQEGQRVTRHYYDVYRLLNSEVGQEALGDFDLGIDCARHARMFFNRADFELDQAVAGEFSPAPAEGMLDALSRDYDNMRGMIFGKVPSFADVIDAAREAEARLRK